MQLDSKTNISPLLVTESPEAQWLEHPIDYGGSWVQIPSGARIFLTSHILSHISFAYILNIFKTYFGQLPFLPPEKTQLLPEKKRSPMSYLLCIGSFVSSCSCELLW